MRDEQPINQDQINSHSSVLTNRRLDITLQQINYWKTTSRSKVPPIMPDIQEYFSNLCTLFDDVYTILNPNEILEMKYYFEEYWKLFVLLMSDKSKQNIQNMYKLLNICNHIDRSLKAGLQKYEYFFRIGTRDVKKIEEGKKILQSGGGFFGGTSKPGSSSKNKNASERKDDQAVPKNNEAVQ